MIKTLSIQPTATVADIEKMKNLGYQKKISIEEGIKSYIKWAKELK